ncbi:LysR family transcriptional regulator [Qipengyuania flava]|uniref:LysR family transcriptional regulator n=1 Tax=Qipengyuania flava TaxID=192812 RepID=UPI001CD38859|nr:LysR family transcriptional regulator [Qipengyuania flava]MCA0891797.1 LysR family transcriptional regulator [Qipengyuania flava]
MKLAWLDKRRLTMQTDLNALLVLATVARLRSFRAAADHLGMTPPAVSQTVKKAERHLGTAILNRTTRSVALTEAGEALMAQIAPALERIDDATKMVAEWERPAGLLRLAVSSIAEDFLSGEFLSSFLVTYPDVTLDVLVTDEEFDIVDLRFDAGVRLQEAIPRDMIAVPVSGEQRQVVVASPAYLAARGTPSHPRELIEHRCVGWRATVDTAPYRWEFSDGDRRFAVSVQPELTTNDMGLMVRLAVAGAGFTIGMEETFAPHIERGELVKVVEGFCPPWAGFYIFYPRRRHLPLKLRALVDHAREWRAGRVAAEMS